MLTKLMCKVMEPFRRSIRNKLIFTMIILSVVPIIAVTGLAAENNRKTMESEVISTNLSNMKWTGIYLGEQFAQLNNLIYTVLISPHISDYLANTEEASLSIQFAAQKNIIDTLTSLFYSAGNHVIGAQMYLDDPNKLFTINATQSDIESVPGIPSLYKPLFEHNKDFIIQSDGSEGDEFQLVRSINRFENQEKLGGISLNIRWSMLDQTLDLIGRGVQHKVLIAGPDGRILYQPEGEAPTEETMKRINHAGDGQGYFRLPDQYVFYNTIDPVGLKLIKIIPTSFINQSALATMRFGIIVGAISVAVSILIAILLAWRTATPIVRLARSMQGLGLIRETEVQVSNRLDEIGLLETKLNNMSSRIKEHIKTEYSISLEKKTAELKALQAQINPHFLQNTLQMIGSMLFTKKPAESYEIIRSLSEMFRYVIRDPDDLASLKSELDHLNNYMLIQQQRFSSRLTYTIEVDETLLTCAIPKLTLQPIVENAFFHGLDTKSGNWKLDVALYREQSMVHIQIRDNGVGIRSDKLAELRKRLSNQSGQVWTHGQRIGIQNVASRIHLHFGTEYGIWVDSELDRGTAVTVRIPMEAGRDRDD
ncbi:sensor histidine kinase [Paenibacillus alkaliterrae]|uniref:sensor histidine kinase n=1 Tax=Paenibacillus alkaliterrae TaxID=320909 RepID=UPI001F3365F2|nr:sensor histidine kinase [Paenibacillus alkaliterrae]MCF2940991.1 sensor histidine kinase [Paenibacillus alkaliterrae]